MFDPGLSGPIRCAGANSRKLDKQTVLPKKVIRLLINLRILDSLRCIVSQARLTIDSKQDARWCVAGREDNFWERVRRHGRFKVLIFGRWEEITSSTEGKHRKRKLVRSSQEQEWRLSWWRSGRIMDVVLDEALVRNLFGQRWKGDHLRTELTLLSCLLGRDPYPEF